MSGVAPNKTPQGNRLSTLRVCVVVAPDILSYEKNKKS